MKFDDEPVHTYSSGIHRWCIGSFYHREDGPARISSIGSMWYLDGMRIHSNLEYQEKTGLSDEDMLALVLKYGNIK